MNVPEMLYKFETAYDRLRGEAGAAENLIKAKKAKGTTEALGTMAEAFEQFATGSSPRVVQPSFAASPPPAVAQPEPATAASSKLAEFEALQAAGHSREAGQFYLDNAEAIFAETIQRDHSRVQALRKQRGF